MTDHIVFAVNRLDAQEKIEELGLEFDETVWVMNVQLLGDMDTEGKTIVVTDLFREMPAFTEVQARFGVE